MKRVEISHSRNSMTLPTFLFCLILAGRIVGTCLITGALQKAKWKKASRDWAQVGRNRMNSDQSKPSWVKDRKFRRTGIRFWLGTQKFIEKTKVKNWKMTQIDLCSLFWASIPYRPIILRNGKTHLWYNQGVLRLE